MGTEAGGKEVEATGTMTKLNQLSAGPGPAQGNGPLLLGAGMDMAGSQSGGDAEDDEAKKRALAAQGAKRPGKASGPDPDHPQCTKPGHPVDASTGHVVDEELDLELPGAFPLVWKRWYTSQKRLEKGQLGRGGWSHSYEQWIEPVVDEPGLSAYRNHQGRDLYIPTLAVGQEHFFRADRLVFTRERDGFRVDELDARRTLRFSRLGASERFWLTSIDDRYGHTLRLAYQGERLAMLTDTAEREVRVLATPEGFVARLEVWAAPPAPEPGVGRPAARPAPRKLEQWVDYAYHQTEELASVTDAVGHAARFAYDGHHRMVKTTLKNGQSFYYRYDDEHGRCIKTWGDGGLHEVDLAYDDAAQTTLVTATAEARLYKWRGGLVVEERRPDGRLLKKVELDDDDYVLSDENGAGEKWEFTYDARGNRLTETDPAGNTTEWTYQGDAPTSRKGADGLVTTFHHDGKLALVGVEHPTGAFYRLDPDVHGRVARISSNEGVLVAYGYDGAHNLVWEHDARGARTVFDYDALGRPTRRTDTLGRVSRVRYDAVGQLVEVVAPDGSVSRRELDPLGNVRRLVDALGQTTELEWGGTGSLRRLLQPDGGAYAFSYDSDERLVAIENPRGEVYRFEHDAEGHIERERSFDGRTQRYGYSRAGRLRRVDYDDGTWRELITDKLGNVVTERSPHGQLVFERDALGRLTKATVAEHGGPVVTELERDVFGRVVREVSLVRGEARETRHVYDAKGRRVERTLPNGEVTKYQYDVLGAPSRVTHQGRAYELTRDALGREVKRTGPDGSFEQALTYDVLDRLLEQRVTAEGPAGARVARELSSRRYHWDALGRPVAIDDARWGRTSYRYDAVGQLVEARRGKLHEVFEYDPCGSLVRTLDGLSAAQGGGGPAWRLGPGNVLKQADGTTYENDVRGRRVRRIVRAGAGGAREGGAEAEELTEYVWDCRDRLREVRLPDGRVARYTYDAFARRVAKEVVPRKRATLTQALSAARAAALGGEASERPTRSPSTEAELLEALAKLPAAERTRFCWDGDVLALEERPGVAARAFVHEPGSFVPMLQSEGGRVYAYVTDHLGTPRELVDPEGRVAWAVAHTAWGRVHEVWRDPAAKVAVESPFRLLGQYGDQETGLAYTRYRYFEAETGRWLSPDPIGVAGGKNLFSLGPPSYTFDPFGLALPCDAAPSKGTGTKYDKAKGQGIYVLVDENGIVRYVGRGDAPERVKKHAVDLEKTGLKPHIIYDNNLTKAQAKHIEQQLIATYGGKNPPPRDENKQLINKINSYSDQNPNKSTYDKALTQTELDQVKTVMNAKGLSTSPNTGPFDYDN
jgi:RHS repeat-associated protein